MNRLWTLGSIDLQSEDARELDGLPVQPKRLALLAYLALATPHGFHRRDSLVALFWPELSGDRARNALSKAVHFLRRDLGDEALRTRGDEELGLDPTTFWCDAIEFERLLDLGQRVASLELYRGPLLDGFFLSGAPEFERWLGRERERLQSRAAQAAGAVAESASSDLSMALRIHWARRAVELAPGSESDLRRLIMTLDRAGDRAGAVHAFDQGAKQLQEDYGLEPSPETVALVDAIRVREIVAPRGSARLSGETDKPVLVPEPSAPTRLLETRQRPRAPARLMVLVIPITLVVLWAIWYPIHTPAHQVASSRLIVLPFRTTGADPSLGFLGEGMVDLLTAKLNGAGGAQVVDPRAALSAWHREVADSSAAEDAAPTLRAASRTGARYVVSGEVVGDSDRLVLAASLLSASGQTLALARVDGSLDDLLSLVDHLVAELLSRQAGEDEQRLAQLTSVSLPAVRAYLDGQTAYRQGRYTSAIASFDRAVQEDSTFALAALGLLWSASAVPEVETYNRAKRLAWMKRERLTPVDRMVLEAFAGAEYPNRTIARERINAFDKAVGAAPDRADLWFMLGDVLYHDGPAIATRIPHLRATAAFQRALELDPDYEAPLEHLLDLAATAGDTGRVRLLGGRYLDLHSSSDKADYVRWRIAIALGDSAALRALRGRFTSMRLESLEKIVGVAQLEGVGLGDADQIVRVLSAKGGRETHWTNTWTGSERLRIVLAINRGRLGEARVALDTIGQQTNLGWPSGKIAIGMYWEARAVAAEAAAHTVESLLDDPLPETGSERARRFSDVCALGQWRITHGDSATAARSAALLARMLAESVAPPGGYDRFCPAILDTYLSLATGNPHASQDLARLDSLALTRPYGGIAMYTVNLGIARLQEARGDTAAALRAIRRRPHHWIVDGLWGLSTYLREEGRLAALVADTAGAILAYRHYLALRSHPDSSAAPEATRVSMELARLSATRQAD
jgi:DNA-binding SARP family transcriptional activator/TolB-like protein